MSLYQLEFFDDGYDIIRKEVKNIKDSSDKVRKGIFARHNELAKMYLELQTEIEALKKAIHYKK